MRNVLEAQRWLRDARICLESAQRAFAYTDYRVTAQNAQLCIEMAAKAIIARFEEPAWRHNPAPQLRKILEQRIESILAEHDMAMLQSLAELADMAEKVAPWHGWSIYGRSTPDGTWASATELCTQETAETLLTQAQRSLQIADTFLEGE